MRILLGGFFESAVVHQLDKFNQPSRNETTHSYYLGLNRKTEKSFFDRASTFISIAESTIVPMVDWSFEGRGNTGVDGGKSLGFAQSELKFGEWDSDNVSFVEEIISKGVLSDTSLAFASSLDLSELSYEDRNKVETNISGIKTQVARHYLCRLFLQIREAGDQDLILILDTRDISLLSEVCEALEKGELRPPKFEIPDLTDKLIKGDDFVGGLFNFEPRDAHSLEAIRNDSLVQAYAKNVRENLDSLPAMEGERALLDAMRKSLSDLSGRQRVNKVFEVARWVAKPLHYVPIVNTAVTAVEDIGDVTSKLVKRVDAGKSWHLLAARATEISVSEYLARKQNI